MTKKLTCSNCNHFEEDPQNFQGSGRGECRRTPDFLVKDYDDWCGEHSDGENLTNSFKKICEIVCNEDVSGGG